ncbi:MAG TPA: DUF1801 domain-containing protein [Chitinophaga sp.]
MQKTTTAKINTVDNYFQSLPADMRKALEQLRQVIRSVAPGAEEVLSYGIPSFKLNGMLVGLGAAKNHCGFYVMSAGLMKTFKAELAPYDTATATIRFSPDKPLPVALVKKLVAARIKENALHREEMDERKKVRAQNKKAKG